MASMKLADGQLVFEGMRHLAAATAVTAGSVLLDLDEKTELRSVDENANWRGSRRRIDGDIDKVDNHRDDSHRHKQHQHQQQQQQHDEDVTVESLTIAAPAAAAAEREGGGGRGGQPNSCLTPEFNNSSRRRRSSSLPNVHLAVGNAAHRARRRGAVGRAGGGVADFVKSLRVTNYETSLVECNNVKN